MIMGIDQIRQTDLSRRQGPTTMQPKQQRVKTIEECVASVGEVFFKIEIVKGDKGFDLDVTEPQLQEAVKTMQMNQKDAVAHIRDTVEDNTVLIFLNAVDSRTAVKKEAEIKAKSLGELEESAGDA